MTETPTKYRIGYAMAPKKAGAIFSDSLTDYASQKGIEIVPIEHHARVPLITQHTRSPFDAVVHKLYGQEWRRQLEDFRRRFPTIPVLDPVDNIDRLHNRATMLDAVGATGLPVGVPDQVYVKSDAELSKGSSSEKLNFPVIAKPLLANGTDGSHKMFLVFNEEGLRELKPPFILQRFVNHGGVVFKVYVAGDHVRCVKRKSLPDVDSEKRLMSSDSENVLPFEKISSGEEDTDVDNLVEEAVLPPCGFVKEMACAFRDKLKLNLFNFDVIREAGAGAGDGDGDGHGCDKYYVIDINYFPGYSKLPRYEVLLTDFFLDIVEGQDRKEASNSPTNGWKKLG